MLVSLTIIVNPAYAEEQTLDIISIDNNIILNKPTDNNNKSFTDLSGHWAAANVQSLVQKGAIAGYADGSFKPDNNISRAEFATVLVKAFNLNVQSGKVFNDTQNHWAKEYIATAFSQGIVTGINADQFAPDAEISREQMAIMIVKAAQLTGGQNTLQFIDQQQVSSWAVDAVQIAAENKIMSGYPDNSFRPQNSASRAEAVTAIVKAL